MPTVVSVFGVEPFRIGGTETFARELSEQLNKRGWRSVLCFLSEPSPEVRRFLAVPNITIEVLENSVDPNWSATKALSGILRRYRPEVLHLHFTSFLGLYSWLAKVHSVSSVFFTDHTSRPSGYTPQRAPFWKRFLVRIINWPLTKVICVSEYGYSCMTALDILPSRRFKLVYNGVDLSRVLPDSQRAAAFRDRYSIPADRTVVVQVSWIIPEKGIPDLLRAAQLVLAKNRNVQFVIVGEGAFREQYMKEAEAMGIADHITWTGLVEDPFGEGVYDVADLVCQLSRWEEVFGWMIAEAMAYRKPVVATRVGGIPELVSDSESGFVVEAADVESAADRILRLLENVDLRNQMGRRGYRTTEAKFSLSTNVTRLIQEYSLDELTNGHA